MWHITACISSPLFLENWFRLSRHPLHCILHVNRFTAWTDNRFVSGIPAATFTARRLNQSLQGRYAAFAHWLTREAFKFCALLALDAHGAPRIWAETMRKEAYRLLMPTRTAGELSFTCAWLHEKGSVAGSYVSGGSKYVFQPVQHNNYWV